MKSSQSYKLPIKKKIFFLNAYLAVPGSVYQVYQAVCRSKKRIKAFEELLRAS